MEMMFAYIKLLCSTGHGVLFLRAALQVDYRPATCSSLERCPVYKVQASCAVSQGSQHEDQALLELNKQWEKHPGLPVTLTGNLTAFDYKASVAVDVCRVWNLTSCLAMFRQ